MNRPPDMKKLQVECEILQDFSDPLKIGDICLWSLALESLVIVLLMILSTAIAIAIAYWTITAAAVFLLWTLKILGMPVPL